MAHRRLGVYGSGMDEFDIFLICAPGLEPQLVAEVTALGFANPVTAPGGVTVKGGWPDIWRLNLTSRIAGHVLARVASFRAMHLAQLDKRARRLAWGDFLRPDVPIRVEASCRKSRIYHAGAAAERVTNAITETLGAPVDPKAALRVMVRIDDDLATISLDTSGESLHKRGAKQAVGRAPLRETMAAGFLRAAGFDGSEPVLDPMCGSGTFVLEAAEIATGRAPGRVRDFAFQSLPSFDADAWAALRKGQQPRGTDLRFHGSDRNAGAFAAARENAERAGVGPHVSFEKCAVSDIVPPDGPPGLVIVNPPYGARIGARKPLFALHNAMGQALRDRFAGWRVGIVTSDTGLARATDLPFRDIGPAVSHGGIRVRLHLTDPLAF